MSDDARLELDDDGHVVGSSGDDSPGVGAGSVGGSIGASTSYGGHSPIGSSSGARSSVVDLGDPDATDALTASALDAWVLRSATPWVERHRPTVIAVSAALAVAVLAGAWWTSRPEPQPPAPALLLENAPTHGGDLGGPRIDAAGRLSVAYTATASRSVSRVDILDVVGPGLTPLGVERGDAVLSAGASGFVQLAAQVGCGDPALATATTASYGLRIRSTDVSGDSSESLLPFTTATTALEAAVRDRCVTTELPPLISITGIALTGTPGSSVVDAAIEVRNDSEVAATVATERAATTGVEVDLSPTILVRQHGTATVPTRLLLHSCSARPALPTMSTLPNAVAPEGSADVAAAPGITLRLGIADRTALSSYAIPPPHDELGKQLAQLACTGRPKVAATLSEVRGQAQPGGGWSVSGTYELLTSGVGVTLGREHFTGPALGEGSSLATTDTVVPGVHWALAPMQLDGGAGRVPVVYSGSSCAEAEADIPPTIAVRVTTADRAVYPFEIPLDRAALSRAITLACGSTASTVVVDVVTGAVEAAVP
jgi:hypothetical protein